jgi:Fe-S-cluster-containing dehydrogenase component
MSATADRRLWKTLDERGRLVAGLPVEILPEPPADDLTPYLNRREFLSVMSASMALAGISACTRLPPDKIIPYVTRPEELTPGDALRYATAITLDGVAVGVLAVTQQGRPIRIEGNPDHPGSLGAVDRMTQASLLSLYDPDRSRAAKRFKSPATWDDFTAVIDRKRAHWRETKGEGLRILSGASTSPTLIRLREELLREFPAAGWSVYDPIHRNGERSALVTLFGAPHLPVYRLDRARTIVSLDADFLGEGASAVRLARDYVTARESGATLFVAEGMPSITGAMAEKRLPIRKDGIMLLARALARELGSDPGVPRSAGEEALSTECSAWLAEVHQAVGRSVGKVAFLIGREQDAETHAIIHELNVALSAGAGTVEYVQSFDLGDLSVLGSPPDSHAGSFERLIAEMAVDRVEDLFLLGGNPVWNAPEDSEFVGRLARIPFTVHISSYDDETSQRCQWHLPEAHELETWGDVRAYDGTATIQQPAITPLYQGRSILETVSVLLGRPGATSFQLVQETWKQKQENFPHFWAKSVHDGFIAGSAPSPRSLVAVKKGRTQTQSPQVPATGAGAASPKPVLIAFQADASVWDGKYSNNGWLQELPHPITKLTWENAAQLSENTARLLGVGDADHIEISTSTAKVRAPVLIVPGHVNGQITLALGYGRLHAGKVGNGHGFNAYPLRTSASPGWTTGARIDVLHGLPKQLFALTHQHHSMEGRDPIRVRGRGDSVPEQLADPVSMYPDPPLPQHEAWAMAIDLDRCIGCQACVIACQSENNIPVVGQDQVRRGREMHWIRIDRYFKGSASEPEILFQPLPCMHCEKAPCEVVCPVGATVHDDTGLNLMVYNRCVGTRFCSNNCPYKVRRFNFFQYSVPKKSVESLGWNPEVTVRSRGVMEKCTYCVQRIQGAMIRSQLENRRVRDGEIVTACEAACPTVAITFGDLRDAKSRVAELRKSPRHYLLLDDLGTRPRTSYLARLGGGA